MTKINLLKRELVISRCYSTLSPMASCAESWFAACILRYMQIFYNRRRQLNTQLQHTQNSTAAAHSERYTESL